MWYYFPNWEEKYNLYICLQSDFILHIKYMQLSFYLHVWKDLRFVFVIYTIIQNIKYKCCAVWHWTGNIRLQAIQLHISGLFLKPALIRHTIFLLKSLWIYFTLVHQGPEPIWFKSSQWAWTLLIFFKLFYCCWQSHLMVQHFTHDFRKAKFIHPKPEGPAFNMQTHQWNVWSTVIFIPWGIYFIICAQKKKKIRSCLNQLIDYEWAYLWVDSQYRPNKNTFSYLIMLLIRCT